MSRKIKLGRVLFLFIAAGIMLMAVRYGIWGGKEEQKEILNVATVSLKKTPSNLTDMNLEVVFIVSVLLVCGFIGCVGLAKKNKQFFLRKEHLQE